MQKNTILHSDQLIGVGKVSFTVKNSRLLKFGGRFGMKGQKDIHSGISWMVINTRSMEVAKNELFYYTKYLLAALFFSIFLLSIISYAFSYGVTKPLEKITKLSKSITEGNYGNIISDYKIRNDEFDILITSFNKMSITLKQSAEKMEQLSKAKSDFLARISHEIRAPLNGIVGCSDLLSRRELGEKDKELMEMILISSDRLKHTIDEVLDFSKIQTVGLEISESVIETQIFLRNVCSVVEGIRVQKGNEILVNIDPKIPKKIFSDQNFLERILINLLSNSNKYTTSGKIEIYLGLESQNGSDLSLKFQVSDNGAGIDKKYLPYIFDPFSQEDESLTREFEGTGLGLPIVKELVTLLGGDIQIESEKEKGTKVIFMIKAKEVSEVRSDLLAKKKEENDFPDLSSLIPLKILVVDDDQVSLITEVRLLERIGYNPDVAVDGKGAIEAYERERYDLIFMDIRMPNMNGIEATKEILKLNFENKPVIIATTGDATIENIDNCKAVGMADFITKPFRGDGLIKLIQIHFENKKSPKVT